MRNLIIIVTMCGLLMQNFSKLFIVANFEMNREYISKNLCIKKAEPENCCKGSCHLKKQLDSDEKKQESQTPGKQKQSEEVQFFQQIQQFAFSSSSVSDPSVKNGRYNGSLPDAPDFSIFHPPLA